MADPLQNPAHTESDVPAFCLGDFIFSCIVFGFRDANLIRVFEIKKVARR